MYFLLGVIFFALGFLMIFAPKAYFDITQGWKNNSDTDPSSMFILNTRFGGIVFVIAGIVAVIVQFIK
jgi:hypothetical protein